MSEFRVCFDVKADSLGRLLAVLDPIPLENLGVRLIGEAQPLELFAQRGEEPRAPAALSSPATAKTAAIGAAFKAADLGPRHAVVFEVARRRGGASIADVKAALKAAGFNPSGVGKPLRDLVKRRLIKRTARGRYAATKKG